MTAESMIFESTAEFEAACSAVVGDISRILTEKNASASVAESLTGGLVASEIVRVPGVSRWFAEGCVTYSDGAKASRLGIPPALIEEHTAVSRPVARAMAEGELSASGTDIAVSTTGLAGPAPDEYGRPAGLVFIGGAARFGSVTVELKLEGSRLDIRRQAAFAALKLMRSLAELI